MLKCLTREAYMLLFEDFDSERAFFSASSFFLSVSSRTISSESLGISMTFTSPNTGRQVRATTSFKVGPNSPQIAINVWFLMLQREIKNFISSCLLLIELAFATFNLPNSSMGYFFKMIEFDNSLEAQSANDELISSILSMKFLSPLSSSSRLT